MDSTLQIRIDSKTKNAARKIFENLGLDTSSAIQLYFRQVINHRGIAFRIITENGFTPEKEAQIIRETQEAIKYGKGYATAEEMHADILG